MDRDFPEKDWKHFRTLQAQVTEALARNVLAEVERAAGDESKPPWTRFAEAERLLAKGRKDVASVDDVRRSQAMRQLLMMRSMNLVSDLDLAPFSDETRSRLETW
jgi:hypothetical protein